MRCGYGGGGPRRAFRLGIPACDRCYSRLPFPGWLFLSVPPALVHIPCPARIDQCHSRASLNRQASLKELVGIDQNGDRPVVRQRYRHVRLELTRFRGNVRTAQSGDNFIEQRSRDFRCRGSGKARSSSLACVAKQRELAHGKDSSADIVDGQIHFSFRVVKDPEPSDLVCQRLRVAGVVFSADADQNEQAGSDLANRLLIHGDGSFGDALDNSSHDWNDDLFRDGIGQETRIRQE